jgi:phosphoketolase
MTAAPGHARLSDADVRVLDRYWRAANYLAALSGSATILTHSSDPRVAAGLDVEPWAAGERNTYVRLAPEEIAGRRIRRLAAP